MRSHHFLVLIIAGCQTTVNLTEATDTSPKSTETSGGNTTSTSTGKPEDTSGNPSSTSGEPGTTSEDTSTGKVDSSTTGTSEASTTVSDTSVGASTMGPDTSSSSGDTTTGGPSDGCPSGWTRARTVTITNEPEKPLSNYQTSIKVTWDDDMLVDFSDLRFVDAMGTPLPHWIEEYTAPIEALVWVKVPAIAAAATTDIEMCYGNPDAQDASNGEATFHFFDGFDGNTLDPTKWEATSPVSFSLGALKVPKGAVYSKGSPGSFPNLLIETKFRMTQEPNGALPVLRISSAQVPATPMMHITPAAIYYGNSGMELYFSGMIQNNMGCCNGGVNTVYGLAVDEGNVYAIAQRKFSVTAKATWKKPFFVGLGHELMKSAGESELFDLSVEWLLIRRFTTIEPTTEVGPEKVL